MNLKPYLTTCLLFFIAVAQIMAQPTLTVSSQTPSLGATYDVKFAEAPGFQPGSGGANQNWDFSNTNLTTIDIHFSILAPADAICSNDFPDADFVWFLDEFEAYNFYEIEDNGLTLVGGASGSADDITFKEIFSNKEEALQLPLSYPQTYSYMSTFTPYLFGSPLAQNTRNGTVEADGYGTLITPSGKTYNNVLRIIIRSSLENISTLEETQYSWILPGEFVPLMVYTISEDPEETPTIYYTESGITNTRNTPATHDFGIRLRQNPVQDQLNVSNISSLSANVKFRIMNALGQEVLHSSPQSQITLANLPTGYYCLLVEGNEGRQLIPFVKQ